MHQAAQAYQTIGQRTASPRDLEAQVLLRAASRLFAFKNAETLDREAKRALREALTYNRKIWTVFLSAANREENPLPADVKANLRRLALFVLNQSLTLEVKPDVAKLEVLVDINRNVAAGLTTQP